MSIDSAENHGVVFALWWQFVRNGWHTDSNWLSASLITPPARRYRRGAAATITASTGYVHAAVDDGARCLSLPLCGAAGARSRCTQSLSMISVDFGS